MTFLIPSLLTFSATVIGGIGGGQSCGATPQMHQDQGSWGTGKPEARRGRGSGGNPAPSPGASTPTFQVPKALASGAPRGERLLLPA